MSLLSSLNTGASALGAASVSLEVISHNVANASTYGYSRQAVDVNSADPLMRGGFWIGQGVSMAGVSRVADSLLGVRLVDQVGSSAQANTLSSAMSLIEGYFNETNYDGVGVSLSSFFDSLTAATADPSDGSLRASVVSSAADLAHALSTAATGLTDSAESFEDSASAAVEEANAMLAELAAINEQITASGGASGDLLDSRDRLLADLADAVGATASIGADGSATLYIGGQAVVSGKEARSLSTATGADGSLIIRVSADSGYIDVTEDVGGRAGGYLAARDNADEYLERLNELAGVLADAVNAQHAAGYDAYGDPGAEVFSYDPADPAASMTVNAALLDDPDLLALAGDASAEAGDAANLEALLALEESTLFDGGTRTAAEYYAALTTDVALATSTAASDAEQQSAMLYDVESLRQSISGVNLDEEAVAMIEVQAAYQAAAQVVQAADFMLRTLMQM